MVEEKADTGQTGDAKSQTGSVTGGGKTSKKTIAEEIEEAGGFWPHFTQWAESRAKPKQLKYVRPRLESTRFAKRGPMSVADWERFNSWVSAKGKAKSYSNPPEIQRAKWPMERLLKRLAKLSKPKRTTPRYQVKKTRRTKFNCGKFSKKHMEKLARPKMCGMCPEPELEMRPIKQSALNYKPTPRIIQLSHPLTLPRPQHCFFKQIEDEIYPRRKMNYHQMMSHLMRLELLSAPVQRPDPLRVSISMPVREKRPLYKMLPRIQVLAKPKPVPTPQKLPKFGLDKWKVMQKPLAELKPACDRLAKPKPTPPPTKLPKFGLDKWQVMSKPFAQLKPTFEKLSKPKPDFSINPPKVRETKPKSTPTPNQTKKSV